MHGGPASHALRFVHAIDHAGVVPGNESHAERHRAAAAAAGGDPRHALLPELDGHAPVAMRWPCGGRRVAMWRSSGASGEKPRDDSSPVITERQWRNFEMLLS